MVLMLELVVIGVFGACLSALLCIITEGTPYEIPKVISLKQGLLRPRIIRSVNWPQWKSAIVRKEKERRKKCRQEINEPIEFSSQKLIPKIRPSYRNFFRISVRNFERYSQTMATKAVDNIKENHNSAASPCGVKNDCKYCGNLESLKYAQSIEPKDNKTRLMIKKSFNMIKAALVTNKNDESRAESNGLHNSKWRKVRTKKRRFILPKKFVVAKKLNDADAEEALKTDPSEDSIDIELRSNGRYCYLEALRIKTNKAEKNV